MNINSGLGNNKRHNTIGVAVNIIIAVLTVGFVYFLIQGSFAKPSYSFSGNNLTISGQYGVKINLSGAVVAHELTQVPTTETRTNGAAIGKIEKGYFKISGSKVYLNVMDENAPNYILITDKNGSKYYINCASTEETNNLYKEIAERIRSAK
jgi:hypothetical protein